jgi:hypothetical protein
MKRFTLMVLLALILPLTAFARTVLIVNSDGTLTASNPGLSLIGSNITYFYTSAGNDLGTVSFTTGPLISGNLVTGGTFSPVLSSYSITIGPGILASFPNGGLVFSGSFIGPISWSPISGEPGYYEFRGELKGFWYTCECTGYGWTTQVYSGSFNSQGIFTATTGSGGARINPEPGTVVLFTTGLCCIGFMVRRNRLKI